MKHNKKSSFLVSASFLALSSVALAPSTFADTSTHYTAPQQISTNSSIYTTNIANPTRAERIRNNNNKIFEQKQYKIQKKINAGESLTRIEQKFATENGLTTL